MDDKEELKICGLWRLDPDLERDQVDDGIICTNGPCWSPDDKTFYLADTFQGEYWAYDYDIATGTLSNKRRVRTRSKTMPASPTARRSTRRAASGTPSSSRATSCATRRTARSSGASACRSATSRASMFGGDKLDEIYVTSMARVKHPAVHDLFAKEAKPQFLAGSLFQASPASAFAVVPEPIAVMAPRKVIITCAVTGAIHTPTMSPHLPVTPERDRRERRRRGARPAPRSSTCTPATRRDGRPTQDPDLFRQFLPAIAAASDVIVNITTGGSQTMTVEERLQPALQLQPEVASLNMGTMNFGLYEMLPRHQAGSRIGSRHTWPAARPASSRTRSRTSPTSCASAAATARGSSSSATTSAISTRPRIFSIAASCSRRCSCNRCSASAAASAPHHGGCAAT